MRYIVVACKRRRRNRFALTGVGRAYMKFSFCAYAYIGRQGHDEALTLVR